MKAYIIEDSVQVRNSIERLFASIEGFEIFGAKTDVSEALEEIRATQPEIIIFDFSAKSELGIEIVRELRSAAPILN